MNNKLILDMDVLKINHNNSDYYGATQSWYSKPFRIQAGCGPTTASNLIIYMALNDANMKKLFSHDQLNYKNSTEMLEVIWNHVTPSLAGLYSIDSFKKGVEKYAASRGIELKGKTMPISFFKNKRIDILELSNFIEESLNNNRPVAFLNLSSGKVVNLSSWHWTLVMGIEKEQNTTLLVLFDEGEFKKIDLDTWLSTTKLKGGFVSFS